MMFGWVPKLYKLENKNDRREEKDKEKEKRKQ
jgi:hypothetical protein